MKPTKIKPASGTLLISDPYLGDPNFHRTVILLTDHNEDGSMGFVLNKPILLDFKEIIPNFPIFEGNPFFGGPVNSDSMFFIHRNKNIRGSMRLFDDIYIGGDFEQTLRLIHEGELTIENIKFFIGYSGWEKEQLNNELKTESWLVANTSANEIMSLDSENLWKNVLKNMGGEYAQLANYPEDPNLN